MTEKPSVDEILANVVGISDPEKRSAYLDQKCADDPELRAEVESLLAAYYASGPFLDTLASPGLEVRGKEPGGQVDRHRPEADGSFRTPGGSFAAPEAAQLTELLDGYEVTELIARGGMGAVYRARQVQLDREVAIKVLPRELSQFEEFKKSFRTEARAMARISSESTTSAKSRRCPTW